MTDYISRDVVIANSREYDLGGSYYNTERAVPVDAINSIPAADVRPVVLCRDCIFRSNEWMGCPKLNGTITGDEFFCKCGIKREES